jgi:hypothetical protein
MALLMVMFVGGMLASMKKSKISNGRSPSGFFLSQGHLRGPALLRAEPSLSLNKYAFLQDETIVLLTQRERGGSVLTGGVMNSNKAYLLLVFLFMFIAPNMANASDEQAYWEYVDQKCAPYRQALLEIDTLVEEIKVLYSDEPETLERVLASQDAWRAYLDAHIDAMYHGGGIAVGNVYKLCICLLMEPIVEVRLQQLRYWRDGTFEGDVCCGHVRRSDEEPDQ